MISVVNYGVGNLGSILNMFKRVGIPSRIVSSVEEVKQSSKLLLPGIGAFDTGIRKLQESGLTETLNEKVLVQKTPVLGICLGMQLMTHRSEEGTLKGLGWIDAEVARFSASSEGIKLRVPHMGWSLVTARQPSPVFQDMYPDARFYFVHSYYVKCHRPADIVTINHYGVDFVSSFRKENIFGVQFHPEKSHKYGMKLLKNFADL